NHHRPMLLVHYLRRDRPRHVVILLETGCGYADLARSHREQPSVTLIRLEATAQPDRLSEDISDDLAVLVLRDAPHANQPLRGRSACLSGLRTAEDGGGHKADRRNKSTCVCHFTPVIGRD